MQRKFKLYEPKRETCIEKWVTVSNDSPQGSINSSRVSISSPRTLETNFNIEPILTPKSIKIANKPVFFRDDFNIRPPKIKLKRPLSPSTPIETPTKVKYDRTGLIKDTKDWRLDSSRSSKVNLNLHSQRSLLSASSDGLDSSRVFFKAEINDNIKVKSLVTVINEDKEEIEGGRMSPRFSARDNGNLLSEEMSEAVLQPRHEPDMSNKVGESRNEIEKLKTEIEELINTNLKSKHVTKKHESTENVENIPTSPNVKKVSTVKQKTETISPSRTSRSPLSTRRKQSNTDLNTTREEPKLKSKTYDPESTREFIRKQKQRRKEKLQQEELMKKESEELKKQKLKQLSEKTTKLIAENVKKSLIKRVRAKSEEKLSSKSSNAQSVNKKSSVNIPQNNKLRARSYDRLADKKMDSDVNVNKTKGASTARSRSNSREPKFCDKKPPVKSKKAVKEAPAKQSSSDLNPEEDLLNVMTQISAELKRNELNNNKDEALRKSQISLQSDNSKISLPEEHISIKSNKISPRNINLDKNIVELEQKPVISVKIQEQKIDNSGDEEPRSAIPLNVRLEMIKNSPEVIVIPPKSPNISINEIKSKEEHPIQNEDALNEIEAIKQKLETSISQSNLERNETPAWLLPPSTLPYPYNFISAVRKKLEIATKNCNIAEKIQSPRTKDTSIQTFQNKEKTNVSVQCSIDKVKEISIPEIVPPKPEELKTFSSHKCRKQLVYDSPPKLKSPTSFKEINKELSQKDKHTVKNVHSSKSKSKSVFATETSDSDTTKNIPEISEEEQFPKSLKPKEFELTRNITFVRRSELTNGENFAFDQIKVDKNSLNHKTKKVHQSDHSDKLKNITFNRQTNNSDLNNLIKPDYKIDTSKLSKKSSEHSNRSKYPSDIENILTQYSKMKLSSKSSAHNESFNSQYSDDFNSSPNNISTTKNKSYEQNPEKSSLDLQTETKSSTRINSSDISKIKTELLASLARKHSSSTSNIPQEESTNKNSDIESLKISSGSRISRRSIEKILESISKKSPRSSDHNEKESSNKTRNSNNAVSEENTSYNEIQSIQSEQEPSKSKITSEMKTGRSLTNSQTAAISHSKREESTIASSIPESSAIKTESIQETNIIKSSLNNSLNEDVTGSTIHSTNKYEKSLSKSLLKSSNVPSLTKPAINLKIENEKFFQESRNNPNQIHLKFQAEVHLLNSFNNSLQQVVAVEKSLLDIDQPNQPSATVNFRRGCGAPEQIESLSVLEPSVCSQDLNESQMSESVVSDTALSVPQNDRSLLSETSISRKNPYFGVSLGMFDQMIRDEDNRLEYLKAFLKLRDKALFDRTKGELALLEIQKKQLRESGQLNDVTIIKKKQRGLIIKLEQERHEMQRLKQAHKQAAKERKNALREQKNIIKQQLSSTDQIPSKIRRLSHLERRQSGPLKVYRVESRTEQIRETTMSKNSSGTDETTVSVTTSSVVTQISEKVEVDSVPLESSTALKPYPKIEKVKSVEKHTDKVKRALLMKEADLEKRRKEAEEVLKWNERLKQEEAAVVELERQAKSIQLDDPDKKRILTGAQLNKIWKDITGFTEKKFEDHKKYQMSKRSLDKFYQNARKIFKEISEERSSSKRASEESYTSDFDSTHSPSKINLSSSAMTQTNDSDTNISPNKMLSERLRKITEASRLDFITSKKDTSASERTTNKNSIVSEVLPTDKQSVIESIHTLKDSSDEVSSAVSGIESIISKKSVQSVIKSKISSIDSDIPELQSSSEVKESIQTVDEVKENSKNLTESIVSEIKQDLIDNKTSEIEGKSTISSDSDLPELEIGEHVKSAEIIDSVEEKISDNVKSEYDQISEKTLSETPVSDKSVASRISAEKLKSENHSEQISSLIRESKIKSDNKEILESKIEDEHTTGKQISEILSQQKDTNNLSENIISEQVSPVKSEENTSKIVSEAILSQSDVVQSEPELKSVINTSSEIEEISKIEEIQTNVTSKSHSETLPEKISEHEKSSESKSASTDDYPVHYRSEFEQYNEESTTEHSDHQSDTKSVVSDHISTKHSLKSEFENEFIKSLSLESRIDKLKTETSLPEELETAKSSEKLSTIKSKSQDSVKSDKTLSKNRSNAAIYSEKSLQEELDTVKSSEKSSTVKSKSQDSVKSDKTLNKTRSNATIYSEKSLQEELDTAKSSEKSSTLKSKSQDSVKSDKALNKTRSNATIYSEKSLQEELESVKSSDKSSTIKSKSQDGVKSDKSLSKIRSNTTFDTEKTLQEDLETTKSSEKSSTVKSKSQDTVDSDKSLNKTHSATKYSEKSLLEELKIAKSSDKSSKVESESQEFVQSDKTFNKSQIEEEKSVSPISEKITSESPKESSEYSKSKINENQKTESHIDSELDQKSSKQSTLDQIHSELSTPHESEPYKTDFETELVSETKGTTEKSEDFETYSSAEQSEIKSSVDVETEKESEPITESKDSKTSEKDSTTVIESPKSTKENESSEVKPSEDNSEVPVSPLSESENSKKSLSEESFEYNKETSSQEEKNVSGVSHIDVRKRVSEILADSNSPRGDKSPRVQDLYVTTYDVATHSPDGTPETGSPTNEYNKRDKSTFSLETPYRSEAEELLRKQLEIEQEIIQLERQQQQTIPYLFMREIPNKPPPPYKPPTAVVTPVNSVIPASSDQVKTFVNQSANVLFNGFISGNLKNVSFHGKVTSQRFVFDLCKEIALETCKPTEETGIPSWKTQKRKFQSLISKKPLSREELCSVMNKKVLQLLNFEPVNRKDNLIIRWSRKKRDHVDEILVLESQTEETEWTNYDSDEQIIKDNLTSDIMNMLISETAQVMCEILNRKKTMSWTNYC